MKLSTIFQNLKSQNISLLTLVIIGIFLLIVIVVLSTFFNYLYKKVKYLTKVRYGFGGKPIFSLLIVFGIMAAIPLTYHSAQQSVDYVNQALAKKDALIRINVIERKDELYDVSYLAVPTINGEAWGDDVYTITWSIEGPTSLKKIEKEKDKDHPSYFIGTVFKGYYEVHVIIEGEEFYLEKTEKVIIE